MLKKVLLTSIVINVVLVAIFVCFFATLKIEFDKTYFGGKVQEVAESGDFDKTNEPDEVQIPDESSEPNELKDPIDDGDDGANGDEDDKVDGEPYIDPDVIIEPDED